MEERPERLHPPGDRLGGPAGAAHLRGRRRRVIAAGWGDPGGKQVFISHQGGYITNYAHLDWVAVEKGQPVAAGQLIGTVGGTGTSWVHLHFALFRNGRPLDPLPYLMR